MNVRSPIHCIVPPHILREIARRGNTAEQAWAAQALEQGERARARRLALRLPGEPREREGPPVRPAQKRRAVFDARHGWALPGAIARAEGEPPSGDPAVDEAFDGAGATWDFLREILGRNSIDGGGMRLDATVHYGRAYDNAFWDGRQMVYGDGDGRLFRRFTVALDVIGHELSHGVIQHEADFEYSDQPGALNESFADVLGSLVKQRALGQSAEQADWLIGRGLFTRRVHGEGLRSLREPGSAYDDPVLGRDPQPAHMKEYVEGDFDNGGVHINSGIPNHAFYRAAIAIGGEAWERAGRIWYIALRDRLRRGASFARAAAATAQVAGELFGRGGREERAVREAWKAVGVETARPAHESAAPPPP